MSLAVWLATNIKFVSCLVREPHGRRYSPIGFRSFGCDGVLRVISRKRT